MENSKIYHDVLDYLNLGDAAVNQAASEKPSNQALFEYGEAYATKFKPRERLLLEGREALSDIELLAIILNTGVKGKNVMAIAEELLETLFKNKKIPSAEELSKITGLGKAKTGAILAMLEFGRRRWGISGARVKSPKDIYALIRHYSGCRQERFISISFNGAHEVLASRIVTTGLVDKTIIHPREVFADIISDRASAFCVAHNHPSGSLNPSKEDDDVTLRLKKAAKILGIRMLDHIIFTEHGYFSYCESKKI